MSTRLSLNDGIVEAEAVVGVVFGLEATEPLQAPWFVAIALFDGLEAVGIVDVGIRETPRLASVPLVSDFIHPFPGSVLET
jgi:hypothetical protein